jgi:SM-20-related protein
MTVREMTAREMMDSLSDTLLCDERILSVSERELLANLLQRARTNSCGEETAARIAHVVGEVVADRAYGILGDSISKRLLQPVASCSSSFTEDVLLVPTLKSGPQPPSPSPPAPSPHGIRPFTESPLPVSQGSTSQSLSGPGGPQPPSPSPPAPSPHGIRPFTETLPVSQGSTSQSLSGPGGPQPPSPSPPAPSPHGVLVQTLATEQPTDIAVTEARQLMPAECVLLDEFLAPAELYALLQDTLQREIEFQVSEVVSPGVTGGSVDYETRRSRVLLTVNKQQQMVLDRLLACLPRVLARLRHDPFPVSRVECQVTASNHGDFFRWHSDNGQEEIASREITFVYFFHREPKQFRGGELRIYDSRWENNMYVPTANYRAIVPEQNQAVLFWSSLAHEITPIECPGGAFADSRFTLNGWFHR